MAVDSSGSESWSLGYIWCVLNHFFGGFVTIIVLQGCTKIYQQCIPKAV